MKPVFTSGQVIVATCNYANQITEGKQYKVTKYQAEDAQPHFTWPAYVSVMGDLGTEVTAHTHRFKPVDSANL